MPTVLITGAHGFIGRHLSRHMAGQGWTVLGLGHGAWPQAEAGRCGVAHWLNGGITCSNLKTLTSAHGAPELIFHLAGGSSVGVAIAQPREDFVRTVSTTVELLEWMRQDAPHAKLTAVSSAAVYGAGHDGPITETATLNPYSPYGHHKLMMESLCRSYGSSYGLHSVVARLFSVFGAGLRKQLLWDFCGQLEAGRHPLQLGGTGEELRDWTDVRDVVRALALIAPLASTQAQAINVGTGLGLPVRQVAGWLADAWGDGIAPSSIKFSGQSRAGDPFSLVADGSSLAKLGFEWRVPTPQAMADYVAWFRNRHETGWLAHSAVPSISSVPGKPAS